MTSVECELSDRYFVFVMRVHPTVYMSPPSHKILEAINNNGWEGQRRVFLKWSKVLDIECCRTMDSFSLSLANLSMLVVRL